MTSDKQNCWEFMNCDRGPGRHLARAKELCPAATESRLNSIHGGQGSGRACWVVAGTYCGEMIQGDLAKKIIACRRCDFYKKVQQEEGERLQSNQALLQRLKSPGKRLDISSKRLGVLIGGSGLIGGALMHYFKTDTAGEIELLSPNSKKLSLREPEDIQHYFLKYQPDFIINSAIAAIDSDARMTYEINCLGPIRLAKMAMALKIPYIHFSSGAVMQSGRDLPEDATLPLHPGLSNYAKSKLIVEKALAEMHESLGLDYTVVRLAVVYGKHDHKIQGFHRLLFSVADQAMPFFLSKPGVFHSYSHTKKVPHFVHHLLDHREEFSGQTYNFVDQEPVELVALIKAIKSHLKVKAPRELYIPYPVARLNRAFLHWAVRRLAKVGVDIRLPAEMIFLKHFYTTQTLSAAKLAQSSYQDPFPETTVYGVLPRIIDYYLTRWRHLNLLATPKEARRDADRRTAEFRENPEALLLSLKRHGRLPLDEFEERF